MKIWIIELVRINRIKIRVIIKFEIVDLMFILIVHI